MARPSRPLSAVISVASAVRRNTGATASWITLETSLKCGSMAMPGQRWRLRLPCRLDFDRRAGRNDGVARGIWTSAQARAHRRRSRRLDRLACIVAPPNSTAVRRAVAGVFSSDPARSRDRGIAFGVDPARSYGDVAELIERERQRSDGVDAVAIMTPNDTHYSLSVAALDAGLDVSADKPVTQDFREALRSGRAHPREAVELFAIAHAYSAYPMTRLRALARRSTVRSARYDSCKSNTSRAASRRVSRTAPRTTGSAGCSIRSAADRRW